MRTLRLLSACLAFSCASTNEEDPPGGDSDADTDSDSDSDTDTGTGTGTETGACEEDAHGRCGDPIGVVAEGATDAQGPYIDGTTSARCDDGNGTCSATSDADVVFLYEVQARADLSVWTEEGASEFRAVLYARTSCDQDDSELACGVDSAEGTRIEIADVESGTEIFVWVDGPPGQVGDFRLRFSERLVRAEGEDCDPAAVVSRCEDGLDCDDLDGDGNETCTNPCGNGALDAGEECDDGGRDPFDGCDEDCQRELADEGEPNDSCAEAAGPFVASLYAAGSFSIDEDEDWFEITVEADTDLEVWTNDVAGDGCGLGCSGGSDTELTVYADDCTTVIDSNDDDPGGEDFCSRIGPTPILAGTYYVVVTAVTVGPDPTWEVEGAW